MRRFLARLTLAAAAALGAAAAAPTGTRQSAHLYTAPDSAAGGGLRGRIAPPAEPATAVLAMPLDDWTRVYRAELDEEGRDFRFAGLPAGKYDLVVVGANGIYEGLTLTRQADALTPPDREAIAAAAMKSTPFFDTKRLHRCAGARGEGGRARGVLQEVRTRPVTLQSAEVRTDIQVRSLKLVLVEDVGPGWQVTQTRELIRQEVGAGQRPGLLPHTYCRQLSGVRVLEEVRELGALRLTEGGQGSNHGETTAD